MGSSVPPAETRSAFARLRALTERLIQEAAAGYQRRTLVLAGSRDWGRAAAGAALDAVVLRDVLWLTDRAAEGCDALEAAKARQVLGRELDALVLDAYAGFDPDAFGAAAGTVRGGGLLLLLTPPFARWPEFPDPQNARIGGASRRRGALSGRFLRRLVRVLETSRDLTLVREGIEPAEEDSPPRPSPATFTPPWKEGEECRTEDQRRAVAALLHAARGHRHRPAVLISDRGRGKTAALGIAAARLLGRGARRIILTGPRLESVLPALEQAARLLPGCDSGRGHLRLGSSAFEFVPPDALCLVPRPAELLLVDEAAAIPGTILQRLLEHYPRIAFASTVHGYEGSGRGFALRFRRLLDRRTPGWREVRLQAPIRWAPGDPLERLAFRALLLDADPAPGPALSGLTRDACEFQQLERERLVEDEHTLGELFGLLVLAHYRTTPLDLRHLLDGPGVSVFILRFGDHVAATALCLDEGGFDAATAGRVYAGKRRLRGHLLPQTLSQHLGIASAPLLRCRRVMRIAVHPAVQGRGLGTRLLRELRTSAAAARMDYLGSSFGADPGLLRFWRRAEFLPVRIGISRDAASGSHSAAVMRPLSSAGQELFKLAASRFQRHLPHMLADALRNLEPPLAAALLRQTRPPLPPPLDAQDWRDLSAFAFGRRIYEVCPGPIWQLACFALAQPGLEAAQRTLLIARVLQHRGWKEVADLLGLSGRKAAVAALRGVMGHLVSRYGDGAVVREAETLRGQGAPP